jgi:intracellular multiplication protein IcmP
MAGQQQPSQSDDLAIMWMAVAVIAIALIVWFMFKNEIVTYYFYVKLKEADFISLFTNSLSDTRATMELVSPADLSFQDIVNIGQAVGNFVRIPLCLIMVAFAVMVYFASTTRLYKRTYKMHDLVRSEKNNWTQINIVAQLDLIKTDIDKGPWAMALTPMQFCKRHNLLEEYKRAPQEGVSARQRHRIDVNLKRGQANKIFLLQLGPLWPGIKKVPPHIKGLFGVFAARINADSANAAAALMQMNRTSTGKMDFTLAHALCDKHYDSKLIQKVINSHGYLLTVMAAMLDSARDDGVQASADFLWLKPFDRRLWYMLNTVGRQTPFVEVGGPFAHWIAEKEIGRPLVVPMIEEATNALAGALKEMVYKPDET